MNGLRIYATAKPSSVGAKVLPMSREDRRFWQLWRNRNECRESRRV